MIEAARMYYHLGPFKRCWPLVTGCREGDDGPVNVLDGCGTETLERCSREDAEPYLDLVQP